MICPFKDIQGPRKCQNRHLDTANIQEHSIKYDTVKALADANYLQRHGKAYQPKGRGKGK